MNTKLIQETLNKRLQQLDIIVYHVRYFQDGANFLEVIILNSEECPLSLDDVAEVTPQISTILDEIITDDVPYFLDVYSPEYTLPLFTDEHFINVKGEEIEVILQENKLSGILENVTNDKIVLIKKNQLIEIMKIDIIAANYQGGKKQ